MAAAGQPAMRQATSATRPLIAAATQVATVMS
jgi:hypothetical protein